MIELITGLPGNAKTLFTLGHVKQWSESDSRPVFYSGIPQLTLPWTEIDAAKWMECPDGSIIVIDECQKIFRNRTIQSQAPEYVTALETHRHRGIDLVFITQHPMLVDPALRRLVGRHRHLVRIWGMEASTVHEWGSVREQCDKPSQRKDSEKKKWLFDKTLYQYYKSAELHTVKRRIPGRVKFLLAVPLILVACFFGTKWALHRVNQSSGAAGTDPGTKMLNGQPAMSGDLRGRGRDEVDPVADAKDYLWRNTPRLPNVAYSAPKYDDLTKPTTAPRPAACVSSESMGCQCYTQQGTPYAVDEEACRQIVAHGYFQEFSDSEKDDRRTAGRDDQPSRPAVVPAEAVQPQEVPPVVAVVDPPAPPTPPTPSPHIMPGTSAPPSKPAPKGKG